MALTAGVLYAGEDVRVTTTMVTIRGEHYPVSGISSFRVTSVRPNRYPTWAFIVVLAGLAVASFVRLVAAVIGLDMDAGLDALFHVVLFLLPVGVAAVRIRHGAHVHTLWLRDAGGETGAFTSPDVRLVGEVADAISRAVHARR